MKKSFLLAFLLLLSVHLFSQSQLELLKDFKATSLVPASCASDKLEIRTKQWPISIEREGEKISKIVLMRAGIIEEIFQPDVPSYPSYFYTSDYRLSFVDGVFIYYKVNSNEINISYVLSESTDKLKSIDVKKLRNTAKEYFAAMTYKQREAKQDLKQDLAEQKEKEKLENSLKGKDIQKLEIVWLTKPEETGMQMKVQFGMKAYAANGKVYPTDNLGGKTPWEDFIITSSGAIPGDEYLTIDTDASKIKNDLVELTVKSKHQPSLITKSSFKLAYTTPVKLAYTGATGCPPLTCCTGTSGSAAPAAELNVCNSPDKNYVLIEVIIAGNSRHKVKLVKGIPFYLDLTGGPGCSGKSEKGSQGGKGGNGGNGGNIIINRDINLSGDNIIIYNDGGRGGKGGSGIVTGPQGSNGSPGYKTEKSKPVNLNF